MATLTKDTLQFNAAAAEGKAISKASKPAPVKRTRNAAPASKPAPVKLPPRNSKAIKAHLDSAAFVLAYKAGNTSTVDKMSIILKAVRAGVAPVTIANEALTALAAAEVIVNVPSVRGEIGQFVAAATLCKACRISDDDVMRYEALLIARQISNGSIKAAARDEAFSNFNGTAAEFVEIARGLKLAAAKAKKAAAAPAAPAEDVAPAEVESAPVTVDEVISPLDDVKDLTRQLAALLDLLADENDGADYAEALDIVTEFAARFIVLA